MSGLFRRFASSAPLSPRNDEFRPWTESEIALAAELWAVGGLSIAEIADALNRTFDKGRSRSSVAAIMYRFRERFPRRDRRSSGRPGGPRDFGRAMRNEKAPRVPARVAKVPMVVAPAGAVLVRRALPAPEVPRDAAQLSELGAGACRFPVAGEGLATLFCAGHVADWRPGQVGGCYCPAHRVRTRSRMEVE